MGQFEDCFECDLKAPFLYRNSEFVPEAYVVRNATLIVGDDQTGFENTYAIISDASFDPGKAAVVSSPNLPLNLEKFGLVLVATARLGQDDRERLRLHSQRAIVEPRIFEGETQVQYAPMSAFFQRSLPLVEAEVLEFAPRKVVVKAPESGLLLLRQKFYKFEDWKAEISGREAQKLNANLISTGVFVSKGDTVTFEYAPTSYHTGLLVTAAALLLALLLPFAQRKLLKTLHKPSPHAEK